MLGRASLERLAARSASGTPPLVIDFAVPPDVEPADAEAAGLERLGMQEILAQAERSRAGRLNELADARELVDQALASLETLVAIYRHARRLWKSGTGTVTVDLSAVKRKGKPEDVLMAAGFVLVGQPGYSTVAIRSPATPPGTFSPHVY